MTEMTKIQRLLIDNDDNEVIIKKLLEICDVLHSGIELNDFKFTDLPPDDCYEHYSKKVGHNVTSLSNTSVLPMGSISKLDHVKPLPELKKPIIYMPKFDGVSVSCLFVLDKDNKFVCKQANTRGSNIKGYNKNTNLTNKINLLIDHLDLSNIKLKGIINFKVRGEIIYNKLFIDENYNTTIPYASTAAGIVNSKTETFNSKKEDLIIQFYEIGEITRVVNNSDKVSIIKQQVKQRDAIRLLSDINVVYKYSIDNEVYSCPALYSDEFINEVEEYTFENFERVYLKLLNFKEENYCPFAIDGIVICSSDWIYPLDINKHNKVDYGKYAWKPDGYIETEVEGIDYSTDSKGRLLPKISFKSFSYMGKIYSKCPCCTTKLKDYINDGIGIGSKINVCIIKNISAQIVNIKTKSDKPFILPTICPYCRKELCEMEDRLLCNNFNCKSSIVQKYKKLLSELSKCTNLIIKNDKGKVVKSGISEKTLTSLYVENNMLNLNIIERRVVNIVEVMKNMDINRLIGMLECGLSPNQIEKIRKDNNINSFTDILRVYPWLTGSNLN